MNNTPPEVQDPNLNFESLCLADFIEKIRSQHEDGFGFTPLLGAGVSAPSGIPLVGEISEYLRYCIGLGLGLDQPSTVAEYLSSDGLETYRFRKWSPRRDTWPDFDDVSELEHDWDKLLLGLIKRTTPSWRSRVFQEAYGAMSEWRTALQFLARLSHTGDREDDISYRPVLLAPQSSVVDTFFRQVVSGKQPTLAHKMFALLSRAIRIKTILTTNFDDLLEKAYEEFGDPLTAYSVQLNSSIPSYQLTAGNRAIIKLHGGRFSLRADYSLDETPSDVDARNFLSFLMAKGIPYDSWHRAEPKYLPVNHLFVMGFSGNDRRIRDLIRESCKRLDLNKFKIFWIAFNRNDEESAIDLAKDIANSCDQPLAAANLQDWFHIVRHYSPGFLLLELYQHISLGIPPAGVVFPTTSRLRLPAEIDPQLIEEGKSETEDLLGDLLKAKPNFKSESPLRHRSLFVLESHADDKAACVAAMCYRKLRETGKQAVWLEMDEIESAVDLFEHLVDAVSRQMGSEDWMPLLQSDSESLRLREIQRLSRRMNFVVFLNAQTGAGTAMDGGTSSIGWIQQDPTIEEDSWEDTSATSDRFCDLLRELVKAESLQVKIVLLSRPNTVLHKVRSRIPARYIRLGTANPDGLLQDKSFELAKTWLIANDGNGYDKAKLRFIAALSFANRTRYISSLWTWAHHGGDIDAGVSEKATMHAARIEVTNNWLGELADLGAIRKKPGGFIWVEVSLRNRLRDLALNSDELSYRTCAEIHHGLAEWNKRLFLASRDPLAAFEVAYHRLKSTKWYIFASATVDEDTTNCGTHALANLDEALRTMSIARHAVLRRGFSRGSRRRLCFLQTKSRSVLEALEKCRLRKTVKDQIKSSIYRFTCATFRLLRDSSRELGELQSAFEYHRQLIRYEDQAPEADFDIDLPHTTEKRFERFGHLGTGFIATRSYDCAKEQFDKLFIRFHFPHPDLKAKDVDANDMQAEIETNREYLQQVETWLDSIQDFSFAKAPRARSRGKQASPEERKKNIDLVKRGIVNLLRRTMQLLVVRGNLYHLISRRVIEGKCIADSDLTDSSEFASLGRRQYAAAARAYRAATLVLRSISSQPGIREETRRNLDDQQFLETYFGLVLSFLRDFGHAHRRLSDAEACLLETKAGTDSMEMAVIELHRAEVFTQQAVFEPFKTEEEMTELGRFRNDVLRAEEKIGIWPDKIHEICQTHAEFSEQLLSSQSYIDDGLHTLARAERLLNQERKNVWWTTWSYELKLKLIELKLFACVLDASIELPYVSLAHTPRGMKSELDRTLIDSIRLSKLDIFRQARVLDTYSSSMVCTLIRWECEPGLRAEYVDRLEVMRELCSTAREELQIKMDEKSKLIAGLDDRDSLLGTPFFGKRECSRGDLDKDVREYVNCVMASAERRITLVSLIDDASRVSSV